MYIVTPKKKIVRLCYTNQSVNVV